MTEKCRANRMFTLHVITGLVPVISMV